VAMRVAACGHLLQTDFHYMYRSSNVFFFGQVYAEQLQFVTVCGNVRGSVQILYHIYSNAVFLFWCPQVYAGRLQFVAKDVERCPIQFVFELVDYPSLKSCADFQNILSLART